MHRNVPIPLAYLQLVNFFVGAGGLGDLYGEAQSLGNDGLESIALGTSGPFFSC